MLTTAGASLFYATIWAAPSLWWLLFWLEAMAAIVVLTFVAPYVFLPLFFKPKPVDDPGIVTMIEDLVRQAGTTVAGVSQLDFSRRTHEANAAVIGFGRSRRVVLGDTLLASFTPSEITRGGRPRAWPPRPPRRHEAAGRPGGRHGGRPRAGRRCSASRSCA